MSIVDRIQDPRAVATREHGFYRCDELGDRCILPDDGEFCGHVWNSVWSADDAVVTVLYGRVSVNVNDGLSATSTANLGRALTAAAEHLEPNTSEAEPTTEPVASVDLVPSLEDTLDEFITHVVEPDLDPADVAHFRECATILRNTRALEPLHTLNATDSATVARAILVDLHHGIERTPLFAHRLDDPEAASAARTAALERLAAAGYPL